MSKNLQQLDKVFQKAQKFHQRGQLARAEQLYSNILATAPDYTKAYANISDVLVSQNKLDSAIDLLKKGIEIAPDNASIVSAMSGVLTKKGDLVNAMSYAQKTVELSPNQADGHYNLANLHLHSGQQEMALAEYQKAIELNPKLPQAHYNMGNLLYMKGDLSGAKTYFKSTIEHAPKLISAYVNLANILSEEGSYDASIPPLQKALSIDPNYPAANKKMGMVLHVTGNPDKAEAHLQKALKKTPDDQEIWMLLANIKRDARQNDEAQKLYEKVLEKEPENKIADQNLRAILSKKIPSWHFDMLADKGRNDAYDAAIKKVVSDKTSVLDIGSGSGLLSMMSARAGATQITSCEMESELAKVATQIVKDNGMADKIKVINKASTQLIVGKDLPEKVDVIVSEILDTGLLGEGVYPSLRHARKELAKPNAIVIPKSADGIGTVIQCDDMSSVNPIRHISGFDLSAFDKFRMRDTYGRIALSEVNHSYLSDQFTFKHFDLTDIPDPIENNKPLVHELTIPITADGLAHAVAFWFQLQIDDTISLSSGPNGEMVHWGQAIYFLDEVKSVKKGEQLVLKMLQTDTAITFSN